jgi:hypothetical protein
MEPTHHILNAACNLLGISLLIIAGLHLTNSTGKTLADEVAWIAALAFSVSCCASYLSIRTPDNPRYESFADKVFLVGLFTLLAAVGVLAASNVG